MPKVEKTSHLNPADSAAVQSLVDRAFDGRFSADDWQHCLGGTHVIARADGGDPIAHAAVVPRTITVARAAFASGYVEGVATDPQDQGRGLGTAVMAAVNELIRSQFELGVLSTGEHHFYERVGWERWSGPTFVTDGTDVRRTPDDDDGIMVLRIDSSALISLNSAIICMARSGDDW